MAEIDCSFEDQYKICAYFGINKIPAVVNVVEGSYYVMSNTVSRDVESLQRWVDGTYKESYIQNVLPMTQDYFT